MNQWSRTRKRIILFIVLLATIVLVGVPFFLIFYEKPTCSDGKLNGDETGIDCGGSCQRLCSAESLPIIIKGDPRVLSIAPNAYEVVALFENPNADAEIYLAGYIFRLYGEGSTLPIKTIEGETYIPKGQEFAIFEGPFALEEGIVPIRATIEWDRSSLVWQKDGVTIPELAIKDMILSRETTTPRLEALVSNLSLDAVSNIDLIALISDESGNIFAASKTYVDKLDPGEEEKIIYTWPRPFTSAVADMEIIVRVFPDSSFIR